MRRLWPLLQSTVLAVALLMAGCATPQPSSFDGDTAIAEAGSDNAGNADDLAAQYNVLAGELAAQRGMTKDAVKHYIAALQYTDNRKLAERATRMALFSGELVPAYQAAGDWARLAPDSLDAQKAAARLAFIAGDADALPGYSRAVVNASASRADGYKLLTEIYRGRSDHADLAVDTLAQLTQKDSDSSAAWYALGLVALRYDKLEKAGTAAQHAVALAPEWDKAVLLRAATLVQSDHPQSARALVDKLPGDAAQKSGYHISLAHLLAGSGQLHDALSEFQRALALDEHNNQARYGLAMVALDLGDLDRAEKAFKQVYDDTNESDQAAYYLGIINERRQHYAMARTWYGRVQHGDHAFDARVRSALVQARQGDVSDAREQLAELRARHPDKAARLYSAEGRVLYTAKRYKEALAVYNKALKKHEDDVDLLYGRSIALDELGQTNAALQDLHHILKLKPDSARAMNALGYLLTNHDDQHEKALQYISKALQADPDNPAILDSMGWVQYHLGHTDKALDYLQRAYRAFPDPEVAAHLGEVLWKSGRHADAQRVWHEGLQKDPDNKLLNKTMDRLTTP